MGSRLPQNTLTLKHFLMRKEVLKLYRDFIITVNRISNSKDKAELRLWVRNDFRRNKHHTDVETIKMMITRGKLSLKQLQSTIPK